MRRVCLVAAMLTGIGGCGLSVTGVATGPEGQTEQTSRPGDGAEDAIPLPPSPPCKRDACGLLDAPPPFARVLYGARTDPCPAGFASVDVTADPEAGPGACACGECEMTATCSTGTITSGHSNDDSCRTPGMQGSANGGECHRISGRCEGERCVVHPPAAVTTCRAPAVVDRAKVSSQEKRICAPTVDSCAPEMCSPRGGSKTCLTAPGDVACPATAPDKHLVGEDVELSCAACTCTNSATCEGTMTFFVEGSCSGWAVSLEAGRCSPVPSLSFNSTKWSGRVVEGQCTNLTPGAAAASVTRTRTICCP